MYEDGNITVGKTAKERLVTHPESTVASFKRFMGTDKKYALGGKIFTAPELSSFVLRKLRENAEKWLKEEVTEAIISVPAYFNDAQRAATKLAGALAGLHVERLINEPSSAALTCRIQDSEKDGCFLVFDFGGGTLDVSVVECFENIVEIISIAGNNHLGGDDFDYMIAKHFCKENHLDFNTLSPNDQALLLSHAAKCKCSLSNSRSPVMMLIEHPNISGSLCLTNELLFKLSSEILLEIRNVVERAIRDCVKYIDEIDQVILVGGSSNMLIVKQFISHLLQKPVLNILELDTVVALGIGVYAGIKSRHKDIQDMLLTDVCPFTLGIGIFNQANPSKSLMSPIIERNSTLPISRVERYFTVVDMQKTISVDIYQGEEMYAEENLLIDKIEISVPPAPAGEEAIDVRFTYDINGLLDIEITSITTQKTINKEIISKGNHMDALELEKRRQELLALKYSSPDMEETNFIIARAQRLFAESTGPARDLLGIRFQQFQSILSSNKQISIQKERIAFMEFLDSMENNLFTFGNEEE